MESATRNQFWCSDTKKACQSTNWTKHNTKHQHIDQLSSLYNKPGLFGRCLRRCRAAAAAAPNVWRWERSPHIWQDVAANLNYVAMVLLWRALTLSPAKRQLEFVKFMARQLRRSMATNQTSPCNPRLTGHTKTLLATRWNIVCFI
jgi:hypothetical protein